LLVGAHALGFVLLALKCTHRRAAVALATVVAYCFEDVAQKRVNLEPYIGRMTGVVNSFVNSDASFWMLRASIRVIGEVE